MPLVKYTRHLDELYESNTRRELVHPDPLEVLYLYPDPADREVVGLVAALLAYGRVAQILKSVRVVLEHLGDRPAEFLQDTSPGELEQRMAGFRHRFQTGREMSMLLEAVGGAIRKHGSLQECFLAGFDRRDETVQPALCRFVDELNAFAGGRCGHLLPDPSRGSACKRLHLFLRWMVRQDRVDPGGWRDVSAAKLIVPLDTHMHRIGRTLGATRRKSADLRTALELTAAFRRIRPDDPVRYDFALTRLGIRSDRDTDDFFASCGVTGGADG